MLVHSLSPSVLLPLLFIFPSVLAQSSPNGAFFSGNGAPGAGAYRIVDDYTASTFFDKFNFYSAGDPTNGHVQYVNKTVAERNGLISVTNEGTARINPDSTNVWPRGGPGRPSVRVISDNTYTHGLFVLDLLHMPWGCGTWPAYWLLGSNWPNNGEIDIIEGVNTQMLNGASLHTKPGCTVAGSDQTGTLQTTNCDSSVNGNTGCGSQFSNTSTPNNYGPGFNNNGGGIYVTEWTSKYIKTWFFPRNNVPASLMSGNPDPSTFGTPAINHQGSCDIDKNFNNMSVIINTAFCGDWAGAVYSQFTQCLQTSRTNSKDSCVDFVGNNPSSFASAYWDIKSLRVYQMPPGAVPSSTYSTSLSSASGIPTSNTIDRGLGQSTSVSSAPYTGPLSSATTSAPARATTPLICPTFNQSVYTNYNNEPYTIGCGYDYSGGGVGIPGDGIIQTPSFEQCLEACDRTYNCLAVSFVADDGNGQGNCYLKATSGEFFKSSSVHAAIRVNGKVSSVSTSRQSTKTSSAAAEAPTGSTPTCPYYAGRAFTDASGVSYSIACYSNFDGSDIGTPLAFDSIAACMPSCSSMSGCVGLVFDSIQKTCQLKSSFTGTQSPNNNMIAARKNDAVSSTSSSSSRTSTTSRNGPGGYGYGYGSQPEPGYGDYGYGNSGQITSTTSVRTSSSVLSSSPSSLVSQWSTTTTSAQESQASSTAYSSMSSSTSSSTTPRPPSTSLSSTLSSSLSDTPSSTMSSTSSSTLSSSSSSSSSSRSYTTSSSSADQTSRTPSSTRSTSPTSTTLSTSSRGSTATASSSSATSGTTKSTSTAQSSSTSSTNSSSPTSPLSSMPLSSWTSSSSTSAQTSSSRSSSWSTASPSPKVLACPNNAADYCTRGPQQQTTCANAADSVYVVSCGIIYYGKIIDTSGLVARDDLFSRAITASVGDCQALCDSYADCKAFNYVGQNCALISRIDGNTPNADAIAGRLVLRAAVSTTVASSSSLNPPIYGSSSTGSSINTLGSSVTSISSQSAPVYAGPTTSSLLNPARSSTSSALSTLTPSLPQTITTTAVPSSRPTITVTTTQQAVSGGSLVSGPGGSYYVYPSQSSSSTNESVTLCFDCGLTPTVITGPISTPTVVAPLTCSARRVGTVTVYTTSTLTTCGPQPTCPASGYVIISGSTAHPSQTIIITTGNTGQPITYTQIPTRPLTITSRSVSTSASGSILTSSASLPATSTYTPPPVDTSEPRCPAANNTVITDSYGMQYRVHCDTLFSEEVLQSQTQNTLTGCIMACDLYNIKTYFRGTQCFGVSWFANRNTTNCLLKSGATGSYLPDCVSCELLTPSLYNATATTTVYSNVPVPSAYTTVVGGSIVYSTYTTTLPASTITLYSTIFTNGATTGTPVGYTTVPASTVTSTATVTVGGTTIVTQGPGGYGGGGGGGGGTITVTINGGGSGYGSGGSAVPTTIYVTRTQVSTYVTNGQTIYSTYGVTTVASTVYIPQTQTVTAVSVSILVSQSIQYVPTTIYAIATQGVTATIVTSVPVTYTQIVSTGGGGGGGGGGTGGDNGGVVTVTQSASPGDTVFVTVTQVVKQSSSSSIFTCRTYATNYLNRLQARAEPTSEPFKMGGMLVEPFAPGSGRQQKQSIFQKEVIMADVYRMAQGTRNLLTGEFDYFFVD